MHRERGDNEDNQGDEQLIRSNNYPQWNRPMGNCSRSISLQDSPLRHLLQGHYCTAIEKSYCSKDQPQFK